MHRTTSLLFCVFVSCSTDFCIGQDSLPPRCATGRGLLPEGAFTPQAEGALPGNTRSWEVIPSVVRRNGTDVFRLEVDANGPVQSVTMSVPPNLLAVSGATTMTLKDDGLGFDRVAGDYIFTSEGLVVNPAWEKPIPYYLNDTNSPPGLYWEGLDLPVIIDLDGSRRDFTIWPQVGAIEPGIADVGVRELSAGVQVSPHFINVNTAGKHFQLVLRQMGWDLGQVSHPVYSVLPDVFDFFVCISSDHVDTVPLSSVNFNCGMHITVKLDYTGSVRGQCDDTAYYGSAGRLKSFNVLDTGQRGVYANNCAHELVHLWAAATDASFGLNGDFYHYSARSNIGSLVGGQLWDELFPGRFFMHCEEGRNAAHHAPPLDKYFMGLIPPELVPVSRTYDPAMPPPLWICGLELTNLVAEVSIADIVARQGLRSPGPDTAQRAFRIGFVAESRGRLFTRTEMTFYDLLARWFTQHVPAGEPDPYVAQNWVPIERFFGENTSWASRIDEQLQPVITGIQMEPHSIRLSGLGFPAYSYDVWTSVNLRDWLPAGKVFTDANGHFEYSSPITTEPSRFFRVALEVE